MNDGESRYSAETLVEALYRGVLSRAPDEKGFTNKVRRLKSLGGEVTHLAAVIRSFLASREYWEKTTGQFLQKLFGDSRSLATQPIDVVSLGSHCLVSYALKQMGFKRYSCPFDWIFSNPPMVEHCLKDSFVILADRSHYEAVVDADGTELIGRCHHSFYKTRFGVERVFNHRDMRTEQNYQYLIRCIQRLQELLKSTKPKAFVLLCPESQTIQEQFASLHQTLSRSTSNFDLMMVMLKTRPSEATGFGVEYITSIGRSRLAAIMPSSKAGGLAFEDPFDDFMFRRVIVTFLRVAGNPTVIERIN